MYLKKIIFSLKKTYIFFFITVLFLNFATLDIKASIFKVNDIEISEPFELKFNKYSVIDKAFIEAFDQFKGTGLPNKNLGVDHAFDAFGYLCLHTKQNYQDQRNMLH